MNAQIVRLYDTVFDRAPDAEGLEFWNNATHHGGLGLRDLANFFVAAPEFAATYGEPTVQGFVESLYQNILDRPGEAEGIAFWTNALNSGLADRPQVVVGFSESAEHIENMAKKSEPEPDHGNSRKFPFVIVGTEGNDVLEGDRFNDEIIGLGGNDTLRGGGGNDGLRGGPGNDVLDGGEGNDILYGEAGNDQLLGGYGDDVLIGGAGNDHLYGGPGADVYRYVSLNEIGFDLLRDFEPGADKLDFRGLDLLFKGAGPFGTSPQDGGGRAQLRYEYDTSLNTTKAWKVGVVSQVQIDVDGNGTVDAGLSVIGVALNNSDFMLG